MLVPASKRLSSFDNSITLKKKIHLGAKRVFIQGKKMQFSDENGGMIMNDAD